MPRFCSVSGDWYKISDDPAKAAITVTNIAGLSATATHANVLTQITNADSTVAQSKGKSEFQKFNIFGS